MNGFTLIELMIVLAIIITLSSLVTPSFRHYVDKAKFIELITSIRSVQVAIETAVQLGKIKNLSQLSAGNFGIPKNFYRNMNEQKNFRYIDSIETHSGEIKVTATEELKHHTYVLKLSSLELPLYWQKQGSCTEEDLC